MILDLKLMQKDAVYIFRQGKQNSIALRYSLRSISRMPVDKIWLVGDSTNWMKEVNHIPARDVPKNKNRSAWEKIRIACENKYISDDFILMNDDFIVLQEIPQLTYYYKGFIKPDDPKVSSYQQMKTKITELFSEARDYEVHVPFIYNKQKFIDLMNLYTNYYDYLHRSLYGNHYNVGGEFLADNKIAMEHELRANLELRDKPFLSLSDILERRITTKQLLKRAFPHRSKYEWHSW